MPFQHLPMDFYKANLRFQLRLNELLRDCNNRWLSAAQQCQASQKGGSKTAGTTLSQEASLQEIWDQLMQCHAYDSQPIQKALFDNQTTFASGLQQAMQSWQAELTGLMGSAYSMESLQASLMPFMQQMGTMGQAASPDKKDKS